jgi:hypothetical protein
MPAPRYLGHSQTGRPGWTMRKQKNPRRGPSEKPLRHAISFLDIMQVSHIFIFGLDMCVQP